MGLTNTYRNFLAQASTSVPSAPTYFTNSNAHIGVGGGTGATDAFDATENDLQGASKLRKAMDATYPQVTNNAMTFRSTFGVDDANWAWAEWGVFNAASSGVMMNRKVEALGTKTSAQSWQFTVTITLTVPAS
jgi:hypothetical protein